MSEQSLGGVSLSVENLGVSYRGLRAVSSLSFDIAASGCLAMVGANGAGKTSTLHGLSLIHI